MPKNDLFSASEGKYGSRYKDHLLEQYKLYIESVNSVSMRRQTANNFFLSINTFLLSIVGFLISKDISGDFGILIYIIAFAGILLCIIWYMLVRSYRQMNKGKFSVVHEIEKKLPLKLYNAEWKALGEGKNKNKYYPFSHIEAIIPWIFSILYLMLWLLK